MSEIEEFAGLVGTAMPGRSRRATLSTTAVAQFPGQPAQPRSDDPNSLTAKLRQFAGTGTRRWSAVDGKFFGAGDTHTILPPGVYTVGFADGIGAYLQAKPFQTDSLLRFEDSASDEIVAEIKRFWTLKEAFSQRGFLHKRGVLLWGPPGSGKTSTIAQLTDQIITDLEGIAVVLGHPGLAADALSVVRKIEPERPIVGLLEDIDTLVQENGEAGYLSLLDGDAQVDNVVFVATTNYPERLDKRFTDRPSRFDTIKYVGMPKAAARRLYFTTKEPSLVGDELDLWVKLSDGYSVAHLREMIIACRCFGSPVRDVAKRLDAMRENRPSSEHAPGSSRVGFAA